MRSWDADFRGNITSLRHNTEFGDFVVILFIAAFARQYLWLIDNQLIAWILTLTLTFLLWLLHIFHKESANEKTPWQFWLIVALPLFIVYGMRAAIPDTSFDVLNYRLVNGERGLTGWPFRANDFFPAFYPLNPTPDMLLGIGRHLLGYRLGTITNFLVLLWTGTILEKLVRPYVDNKWLRMSAVLLILWTEHTLFLVNNYMVDLLALPFLLLATRIALESNSDKQPNSTHFRLGLYLGASVCVKLLNLAYCIPIVVVYVYGILRRKRGGLKTVSDTGQLTLGFFLPLLPFTVYIWRATGNPMFPFYNTIFHSPFWPNSNLGDGRWGPHGLWETIIWPLHITLKQDRMGELSVYSGRISLVLIVALLALVTPKLAAPLRLLALITIAAAFLWAGVLTGYARYALFVEIIGGVTLVGFASRLLAPNEKTLNHARPLKVATGMLLLGALLAQCTLALKYIANNEWSMRPTVFQDPIAHQEEAVHLLKDYDLAKFLPPAEKESLTSVGMWVESGVLTSGFQSLLTGEASILCAYVNDYFYTPEGRDKFAAALQRRGPEGLASLCLASELDRCRANLARWQLEIVHTVPIDIPVYSGRTKVKMVLLTLAVPPAGIGRDTAR